MYYITNYDACDRYPKEFYTFKEAMDQFLKLRDEHSVIEYFDKWYNRKIVYWIGKNQTF